MVKRILLISLLFALSHVAFSQCNPNVPAFVVNLTGNPDSTWTSPNVIRDGYCCGVTGNDRCISFTITLDPLAQGISFDIIAGAIPGGALFYQVNCGPPTPLGEPICLNGPGPHMITFCKPGNNANIYQITSIPGPVGGGDITINDGCVGSLQAAGFDSTTVTWNSIAPGNPGDYNNYLSCTSNCLNPTVTAVGTPPPFVDYMVCGQPAAQCNTQVVCDTVRVYFNPTLGVTIMPQNPTVCFGQTNTVITGIGSGGTPPYTYLWNNTIPGQTITVGVGTYTVMLSDSSGCPPVYATVTVTAFANPITANAGPDDTICIQSPIVPLNGTVTGASGGVWSGGAGIFSPNDSTVAGASYIPTATELNNGFVDLILSTTGNGSCPGDQDTMRIYFLDFIGTPVITPVQISCYGANDGAAGISVVNGIPNFTYTWAPVPIQIGDTVTNLGPGYHYVTIENGIGCIIQDSVLILEPNPLAVNSGSTNVSCPGGSDGSAYSSPTGGTIPYSFSWAPGGQTTDTISGLTAGTYIVTITDANGCLLSDTVIVNEPPPLTSNMTSTPVSCFGGNDGTATTTVGGGTPGYSYVWAPIGGTAQTATGLSAGTYFVIINDANGCSIIDTVIITEPASPVSVAITPTDVSCFGASDGSAVAVGSGGTAPYTYSWSPSAQIGPNLTNVVAGIYAVTVTDTNGCAFSTTVTINEPPPLQINLSQSNVLCNGGNTGTATVSVSGGTPGYSYSWNPGGMTTPTINGLSADTYVVVVTDTNGCQITDSIGVGEPAFPLTADLISSDVSCFGGSDGSVSATVSGGTPGFTYVWLPGGQTTSSVTNLPAGTYYLTITDTNGCTYSDSVVVNQPPPLVIGFNPTNVSCFGGSNGSVTANVIGGTPGYLYSWSPVIGFTSTLSGLSAGTYTVTVTDSNGCVAVDSILITEPAAPLSSSFTSTNVSCFGGNDGAINYTVNGGTPAYSYSWSPGGQTTPSISGLVAGTYIVTTTDANGCTLQDTIVITEPQDLILSTTITDVSCNGGNDGWATVSAVGGTPNYSYLWSPGGQTSATISAQTAGNYSVTVTDANGCQQVVNVVINEPLPLTVSLSSTPTICFGSSDGSANATPLGGTAPYSFNWVVGGQTTGNITGQPAGTYYVIITDNNGCSLLDSIVINEPPVISVSVGSNNSSCGLPNGTAYVIIDSGGVAPFTYSWSPTGGTNDTANLLLAGSYTVQITDANGCTVSATVNVNDNAAPVATISGTNISCFNGTDGTASVSIAGGTPPFSYAWSPSGGSTASVNGLSAGNHTVVITDGNGCLASTNILLTQPDSITNMLTVSNVSCAGGSDGGASINVIGGTPGYSFNWLPMATGGDSISGLVAGNYSVVTTDTNGCTQTSNFTITEPLPIAVNLSATDALCAGDSSGTANALASGGVAPYIYHWMPINVWGTAVSNLNTGTYIITVTDANNCVLVDSITINEPLPLSLTMNSVNSTCGGANGQASVIAAGGYAPYAYSWSPFGGNGATASGLPTGTYTVNVVDSNGCPIADSVQVNNTPGPTVTVSINSNVSCFNGANGSATANVTGGTTPFSYQWSPSGGTGATATGLTAGTYSVTITDSNGCQATALSPLITQPDPIVSVVIQTDISCFGSNDGSAIVNTFGGTPNFTYLWLPSSSTGPSVNNLGPGVNTLITTDANGCEDTTTFTILEPTQLVATVDTIIGVSCFGGSNGSATIVANGGTPGYNYSWSPSGGTGATASGLAAGNYTVNVEDVNGCVTTVNLTITQPSQAVAGVGTSQATSCFGGADGSATVTPSGGVPGYTYLWSPTGGTNQTENGLSSGNYSVLITDSNGCQASVIVFVPEPPPITGVLVNNEPHCGQANGAIFTQISGGTPGYTYLWTPSNATTPSISNLAPGAYSVDVTDSAGCVLTLATTLTNIPGPTTQILASTSVSCFGGNNGTATGTITGGTSPYALNWTPYGGNGATASGLIAGTYTLTVTDSLGCVSSDSIVITAPTPVTINVNSVVDVSCAGGSDGQITVSGVGGSGLYAYSWSPNVSNTSTASNLAAGVYEVTVTDANGCSNAISIVVNEPLPLLVNFPSVVNPTCFGSSNGSAQVVASGGTIPYNYLWSNNQTGGTILNLTSGTYSITITDTNGCTVTDSITLVQPQPVVTTVVMNDTICLGQGGTVVATASGGTGPYAFAWQPPGVINAGTLNDAPTTSTNYTVLALDQNGCPGNIDTAHIVVYDLNAASIQANGYTPICPGQVSAIYVDTFGVTGPLTYLWSQGLGTGPGAYIVSPVQPTTFFVTVTNSCGVSVTDSILIDIAPPPTITMFSDKDSSCVPGNFSFFDNSIANNPPDSIVSWYWNFGDNTTSQLQNPQHTYNQPGTYQITLTVSTSGGCVSNNASVPFFVTVFPNPIASFSLNSTLFNIPSEQMVTTNNSVGATTYLWNFGDGGSSTAFELPIYIQPLGTTWCP